MEISKAKINEMKYICKIKYGYKVLIRCPDKTYHQIFYFYDFLNNDLALFAAKVYRDKICKLEKIPVVDKNICKKSHNKTGFYRVYKQGDEFTCDNQKIKNPKDSLPIISDLDTKRYGMPVKRITIKREENS